MALILQLLAALLKVLGMILLFLALIEAGIRLGRRHPPVTGPNTTVTVTLALLGLLIAFTFSGAATRFDARRDLIVREVNAISNAFQRVDLVAAPAQPSLRADFRAYVDARLAYYAALNRDSSQSATAAAEAAALQQKLWRASVAAVVNADTATRTLVLSGLNEMVDITTTRAVALETHPPGAVYLMLAVLVCAGSLLVGYEMAAAPRRNWVYTLLYSSILALALYIIGDLEEPRGGLIRITAADHLLRDLRRSM